MNKITGKLINNRNFASLWMGQTFEHIADGILWMTFIEYASKSSLGSVLGTSILMFWLILPVILFGQLVGVYIDRFGKKKTMITVNIIRIIISAIIGIVMISNISIVIYYLLVFLLSMATQFFIPAKSSIIPTIIPNKELVHANSVSTSTTWIVTLLGLATGGILVAHIGKMNSILIVILCYVLSTFFILLIQAKDSTIKNEEKVIKHLKGIIIDIKDGLKIIIEIKVVSTIVKKMIILMGFVGVVFVETVSFTNILTNNEQIIKNILALGYIVAAIGGGVILGPVIIVIVNNKISKLNLIRWSFIFLGFSVICLSFSKNLFIVILLSPFMGIFFSIITILADTILQTSVPEKMLGRVFGTMNTLRQISFSLASIIVGILDKLLFLKIYSFVWFAKEQLIFLTTGIIITIYGILITKAAIFNKPKF